MIEITLADGSNRSYSKGITPLEIAQSISKEFAREAFSASLNGRQVELSTSILEDAKLEIFTWEDALGKKAFWHSSAHLLAQAILEIFPHAKLTIGPPISEGFYYDVDFGKLVPSEKDFEKIEKKMLENARKKSPFKLYPITKSKALDYFKDNNYKLQLIENLEDGKITFCTHDNFTDLCRGGHLPDTSAIKAIKLISTSGAYWRGDEKNKQLTRVRGISFPKQKLLEEYLLRIEEAKKRDHRKLGKELKLFTFSNKVGSGLPLWLPKGTILRKTLEGFLAKAQKERGYEMVISPHIGHKDLYQTSGHWEKYGEDSFRPIQTPQLGEEFLLKPMNCPHHCEIYNSESYSYRDMPIRFAEFGTVYRYEQSGELHGLSRTRGFTQDDAHIFCRPDQLLEEFKEVIDLVLYVFDFLGFKDYKAQISLRDPNTPEKYIGSEENWQKAEQAIIDAAKQKDLETLTVYGEAAFYGPKLDFMIEDALQRNWQLGTIQVDYNLPERFDLKYKGSDNNMHRPIMIHRAPFGSLERFIAILIEHTGGNFPFWLAPVQISILPIGEKHILYAKKVLTLLSFHGLRAFVDGRSEKITKKIRESELSKIPFMLILGDREEELEKVTLRKHGSLESNSYLIKECLDFLLKEKEIKG